MNVQLSTLYQELFFPNILFVVNMCGVGISEYCTYESVFNLKLCHLLGCVFEEKKALLRSAVYLVM
jgi:hypothetical protein